MRNTRKWLILLLTIVMLVNTLGVTAMAAENESPISLRISYAAESDSPLQVEIVVTQAQTVADGKLVVTYDAGKLTYTGTETGAAWLNGEQVTLSVNPTEGKVILAFASADAATTGVLFTLSFSSIADSVIAIDDSSYITGVDADLAQEVSTCPSARFNDVANMTPAFHTAIDYMVANGYLKGLSQTAFGPDVDLTRAMIVTILYRVAGTPDVEGAPAFSDVPDDVFYTDPVAWAAANGITKGVSNHLFAPDGTLSRQELVTFLYRFAGYMGYDRTATTDLSTYTDSAKVPPYAVQAFQWAVATGIVKGTSATTLDPELTTTRAQVSMMIYRMLSAQD